MSARKGKFFHQPDRCYVDDCGEGGGGGVLVRNLIQNWGGSCNYTPRGAT